MSNAKSAVIIVASIVLVMASTAVSGDTVISSEEVELLDAGNFEDSGLWQFSSTKGFSQDPAEYTIGMVADQEMSFTHSRPDNFLEETAWASSGCSSCNATFGEADGVYSWSRGPDITMSGYEYPGLQSREIENVSLVIYFSIPDSLNDDEVNILLQNHGSDILVRSFAKTLSGIDRMTTPLVIQLDEFIDWGWHELEGTQFTVDYVSDNQGADDSEVRVDSVGLRVKFHEPWYSFENSKAVHKSTSSGVPVIDFGPYDGEISGLIQKNCGLSPDDTGEAVWQFSVDPPADQSLGRIHIFGEGNHSVWASNAGSDQYTEVESGDILQHSEESYSIRIIIEDGCVSRARVDVNDPHLLVSGRITGGLDGLSASSSYIRFAIGENLIHSEEMRAGPFSISIPIGHALPTLGGEMEIGVGARFQWSSNGTSETTVVHIGSMSISGGFSVDWDRDPSCNYFSDLSMIEDQGGRILSMASYCTDDITASENLLVTAESSDIDILRVSGEGNILKIDPQEDASGEVDVMISVFDESGNSWEGHFSVVIEPVQDPPEVSGIPQLLYVELGETAYIHPLAVDRDSEEISISSSKSWALIADDGSISIKPVEKGEHSLIITFSDGYSEVSREVSVIVTAKPDMLVESLLVRTGGFSGERFNQGDVVEIVGFVRNQGRGVAENATYYCRVNDVLVGTGTIRELSPGDLKMAICDVQLMEVGIGISISVEIDGTNSIDEVLEENNQLETTVEVEGFGSDSEETDGSFAIILVSLIAILFSFTAYQMSPGAVRKDFERRK